MDCRKVQNIDEKVNCEKYLKNAKIEMEQTDPRIGENPTEATCKKIDNTERRNLGKGFIIKNTKSKEEDSDVIPK